MSEVTVYFAKVRSDAVIPSKDDENGGYDIYANFSGDFMSIAPHETVMIPTGIASAFPSSYVMVLKERGSTGTKGIGQRCGVIDSGFRNEWQVPITNTTDHTIVIAKIPSDFTEKESFEDYIGKCYGTHTVIYPYSKAISQALLLPVPEVDIAEMYYDDLKTIPSKRGMGMLGSTSK